MYCVSRKYTRGGVAYLQNNDRFIFYLVTKTHYSHKPTYENIASSLNALRKLCIKHNILNLAIPRLGCGLDGMRWKRVRALIKYIFEHTDVHITVYVNNKHETYGDIVAGENSDSDSEESERFAERHCPRHSNMDVLSGKVLNACAVEQVIK